MSAPGDVLPPDAAAELMRECLRAFGAVRFRVTGGCMAPVLPDGSVVTVSARQAPRLGDVVLVRQDQGLRLHRLVLGPPLLSADRAWRTKGDGLPALDAPVRAADVLGTVVDPRPRSVGRAVLACAGAAWRRLWRARA